MLSSIHYLTAQRTLFGLINDSVSPLWWLQVIADLEDEKRRHAEDTAEGDDVTYILEKEKERLQQQVSNRTNKAGPVFRLSFLNRHGAELQGVLSFLKTNWARTFSRFFSFLASAGV